MNSEKDMTRRRLLGLAGLGLGVLFAPARALANLCRQMIGADAGPFYPVEPILYASDLLKGTQPRPGGSATVLYLFGRVVDAQCRPVPVADVEIWQCDADGQYKHPNAPKTKPLDPDFLYFSKSRTAEDGTFLFRTVRPASYQVFGIKRAPHIHIRIKAPNRPVATTEVYFAGREDDDLRLVDRVFQSRGARRGEMVVALRPANEAAQRLGGTPEPGALACEYDVSVGEKA